MARWRNPVIDGASLVVAQEVELRIEPGDAASWTVAPEMPELYFCRDLKGYGWCFRKEQYLNVGLGRLDRRSLPKATAEFVAFLQARRKVRADAFCGRRNASEPRRPQKSPGHATPALRP